MPREVTVQEWIEELASGRWVPMRGQLGDTEYNETTHSYDTVGNARCCLGVLCEMVGLDFHGADTYPDVDVFDYAPWLVDHYVDEVFDTTDRFDVIARLQEGALENEVVLSDFAGVNDQQFQRRWSDVLKIHVDTKPKDFGPVIEKIRAWYGLEEGEQ